MTRVQRLLTVGAIAAITVFGTVGIAAAETTPSSDAKPAAGAKLCEKAKDRLATIEAKMAQFPERVAKVQARIDKAKASGHDDIAARLEARLAKAQERHAHVADVIAKIHARCG